MSHEIDDKSQQEIGTKYQDIYSIGLNFASKGGEYKALGTDYTKLFNAQDMQDEINKLVFWATESKFQKILKDVKINFCYNHQCRQHCKR